MGDQLPRPRPTIVLRDYAVGDVASVDIATLWPAVEFTLSRGGDLFTVLADGEPVGFLGCIPHTDAANVWYEGHPWVQHELGYLRQSRKVMQDLFRKHGPLFNFLHDPDPRLLKWLRWMGCEVEEQPDNVVLFTYNPDAD